MSESQIDQLKLAEKLEHHINEKLGYAKFTSMLGDKTNSEIEGSSTTSKVFRESNENRVTKFDLLPLLNNPKIYRIFEFISRNVQTEDVTSTLRSQLQKFDTKR